MPWGRYVFFTGSVATCQHCGTRVRLRHYWPLFLGGVGGGSMLVLAVVILSNTVAAFVIGTVGVVVPLALGLDYWSWRALPWDAAEPGKGEAVASQPPAP